MTLAVILILAAMIRIAFLLGDPATDTYVHKWNIALRRQLGNPWRHEVKDSLIIGKRGYPPLYHYLISLFPESWWMAVGRAGNIVFDCGYIAAAYVLSEGLFSDLGISSGAVHPIRPGASVAMILATSPLLTPVTSRIRSLGARPFGAFLSFFYILCLYDAIAGNHVQGMLGSILFGFLILLSSQFAMQYMLLQSLILSIIYLNILPLCVLATLLLLTILMPQAGLRDILSFKLEHAKWYLAHASRGTSAADRNLLTNVFQLPGLMIRDPAQGIYLLLRKSPLLIALYSMPPVVTMAVLLVMRPETVLALWSHPLLGFMTWTAIGSVLIFLFTSMKPFVFLGQAERYFEYSIPFISILFVHHLFVLDLSFAWVFWVLVFQAIISIMLFLSLNSQALTSLMADADDAGFRELCLRLQKAPPKRILTIPTKLAFRISSAVQHRHAYYYRAINERGKGRGFTYKSEDYAWFELPDPRMERFVQKYQVDTVIVQKSYLKRAQVRGVSYDFTPYIRSFENNGYLWIDLASKES